MPRGKKKVAIGGLTHLSSEYSKTIQKTPPPSPPPAPPPPESEEEEEEKEWDDAPPPEPAKSKKQRELTEEHKNMLRERLAKMRETQKQQREEKKALTKKSDISELGIEAIFEKKYNSQFDFLKEKISAITDDLSEMKKAKKEKAELKAQEKAKAEAEQLAKKPAIKMVVAEKPKETTLDKPVPTLQNPYATPLPPATFKPPTTEAGSFRQQFRSW
jgi:hypothetical protein